MIDTELLLAELKSQLNKLQQDLQGRLRDDPSIRAALEAEWTAAREAKRTAETFESWALQINTQAAVHWVLSCVFLRFIEDNQLVDRPWLAGTPSSGNLALARDRHDAYFQANPLHSDRDYLLTAFREAGKLPGLSTFFDERYNPVFRLGISGDAAMSLRQFWQRLDTDTGELAHDFTDETLSTRFLGDLYQDLSEDTRKRYALLQTPDFVEEFILDRTLTPAIQEFGYATATLIDPTCGSGHFLLGTYDRLVKEWQRSEPGRPLQDVAQKALSAVAGVDLNPFAVAISRFRLLVAALRTAGIRKLREAPDFKSNVAIGDGLLHGKRFGLSGTQGMFETANDYADTGLAHAYASEDLTEVNRVLGRQYHAVVGNPPYIVVKDSALNAAYRQKYTSCHMKYSLGAPFTERFFELAVSPRGDSGAGYVGLITANSFMKREFGSKLIEQVLPRLDLTHVVDTSGAYIPGHGTPTVILFGRHRAPVDHKVRTVMGIKGEPSTPDDPARGLVWSAIVDQIDRPGSESDFVSATDTPRATIGKHPWSIGGGGAADLKEVIEADRPTLGSVTDSIGITSFTLEDDVFVVPPTALNRYGINPTNVRGMVSGDELRDWNWVASDAALFPYSPDFSPIDLLAFEAELRYLWPHRTTLSNNKMFGKQNKVEAGLKWWEYGRLTAHKLRTPLTITFAEIATHNHFVLDRGGKVFKQTAPVIKLPAGSSEEDHLGLLGLLNSSVACFWLKQVCFPKDGQGQMWEERFAFNATNVAEFPLSKGRPLDSACRMDALVQQLSTLQPSALLASSPTPTRASLNAAHSRATQVRQHMIGEQEELDWHCYRLYELLPAGVSVEEVEHSTPVEVELGERAFEIVLARRVAAGKETTNWFDRHGSTPTTEIPARWPETYRRVVQRRVELIERVPTLRLLEQPLYKRRWNSPKWEELEQAALRNWLLDRLESPSLWPAETSQPPRFSTTYRLASALQSDSGFMQVAELYAKHADFDVHQIVADLVVGESVPLLPSHRYKPTGLAKRAQWEDTWTLQRREDAGENVGTIPVPPKYKSTDFQRADYWRLRGPLDVPKERWVSLPGCERSSDSSLPIAWAGWNHLQLALALANYYQEMKDQEGWTSTQLKPLLAGLKQLLPWLLQWHNEPDPVYGERMGTYFDEFLLEEARQQGFTIADLGE